ncbi:MAG: sugar ABC transporter permease [bacterium]|nr:sugar ABC transporter permease [bacterium]MDE0288432.1 sugar ABC transporter permease [bacterium]MDE0438014.1 sugar ABC transporter permease [bacterium]
MGNAGRSGKRTLRDFTVRDLVVLVGPASLLVIGLYLLPFFINAALSLFSWTAFRSDLEWIGLENYRRLDQNGLLWPTIFRTLQFTVICAGAMVVGSLILALGLERNTRSNRILRTVFLLPLVLSPLAAGFVFRALLGLKGTVNTVLSAVTGSDIQIAWLGSGSLTLGVVGLATAWRWFPMILIVFLAGLISIPTDAIDAAKIDGAGPIALIRYVKLPLLAPAMTFAVVVSLIVSLNVFETIVVLTDGGPGRTTEVLNFLIIQEFGEGRFASAAALSTVLYGSIFVLMIGLVTKLRRSEVTL